MKSFLYTLFSVATAMIGYTIHHSIFWAIMDFIFTLFAWAKWLILHQVTWAIIKHTFAWFVH